MNDHKRPDDVAILRSAPRVSLARWPTPVEQVWPGLWVKRDDLCGFGRGGTKARKIEHVLGHVTAAGRDELITVAGNVTNLAFDLISALDRTGVRGQLLIADDPPVHARDREEIFADVLDRVRLIGPGRLEAASRAVAAYRAGRKAGRRPFLLLPGASHPAALIGNACGFLEMVEQFAEQGTDLPGTVFITVASGSTMGGFLLAENALRARGIPPIRVVGVQVYPGAARAWTWAMVRWAERSARLGGRVPFSRIEIDDSALHGGFGRFPSELADACGRVADEAGIAVDPIFGGKTWRVMERYLEEERARGPVLYWHCGYTPEWRVLGTRLLRRDVA